MGREKILVTGGGGFLGRALLLELHARGHSELRTINRGSYPELERLGIVCHQGDIADYPTLKKAMEGVDLVFHVAAKPGVWGDYESYHSANVVGTENVLLACRELGIRRLVYTSSPSVVFGGGNQDGVDESVAYPRDFLAAYPKTKAVAERLVLAANGPELATVSLRPHLIWGPGDRHLIPRVLDRARRGRLRLIGDGSPLVDAVYIDNAVEAHLCAMERLSIGSPIAGKIYFVTNQEPWPLARIINGILAAGSLPPLDKQISLRKALVIGQAFEWIYTFFRIRKEPPLTRFVASQLGTSHWYDPKAARDELGYFPRVSMEEGFRRLAKDLAPEKLP